MEHKGDPEPGLYSMDTAIWPRAWEQSLPLCHLTEWMDPERPGSWWEKQEAHAQPDRKGGRESASFMNLTSCVELVACQECTPLLDQA